MPKITKRKNIHHLYGPKSRLQDFPKADWRFLVRAAANTAIAFSTIHDAKCVIGDVNHGSIMVAEDATVRLIDCDSFQVNVQNHYFRCEVGIETFTPPELQGKTFRDVIRTANHDNFGLAVMIFHLLFMGRHPFAGRFSGAGDMPIARAIKECRFPYGANQNAIQMSPPPGTPPLSFAGGEVAGMFETAFSNSTFQGGRPTARAWVLALQALETKTKHCTANSGHWHPAHLSTCPWCQMEAHGAKPLFPFIIPTFLGASGPSVDLEAMWRHLNSLQFPNSIPAIPVQDAAPSALAKEIAETKIKLATQKTQSLLIKHGSHDDTISLICGVAVCIALTVAFPPFFLGAMLCGGMFYYLAQTALANSPEAKRLREVMRLEQEATRRIQRESERLQRQITETDVNIYRAETDWRHGIEFEAFDRSKTTFVRLKNEADQIPSMRLSALERLKKAQQKNQLDRFLDQFQIEDAKIEGIGPGRKQTLASYGVETAEDIDAHKVGNVPGFGPKMVERLMKWRRSIERNFVFDPTRAVDPRDIRKIEQEFMAFRVKTEIEAKAAFTASLEAHARLAGARQASINRLTSLKKIRAQLKADLDVINK